MSGQHVPRSVTSEHLHYLIDLKLLFVDLV